MRIGVLGTGAVGTTIATKLVAVGHEVLMGSRSADNERALAWAAESEEGRSHGTFADAASFGEVVFNCTSGAASLQALGSVPARDLEGKTLVDLANPLQSSPGGPVSLSVSNTDSLAEQIQRALPGAKVVKTLNTVNHEVMVDPARAPGEHEVFVCGDDDGAKQQVVGLLSSFGWPSERIVDLGDLFAARGLEAYLLLWLRLRATFGTGYLNIQVRR